MNRIPSPAPTNPPIRCALCNRLVDKVVTEWSDYEFGWIIVAYCHSDQDRMTLAADFFYQIGEAGVNQLLRSGGVAFRKPDGSAWPAPALALEAADG